jgi:hypothetical protein
LNFGAKKLHVFAYNSIFRFLPPAFMLILLAGVIDRYFSALNSFPYLLIAAMVSLIPRDIASLFIMRRISERLLHIVNIVLVMALVPLVFWLDNAVNLGLIAPTRQGLIDNLWSSLIVAMLVLQYLRATNMSAHYQDGAAEDTAFSNHVVRAYTRIKNKYDPIIWSACAEYACSRQILYAVLIYEDMNRPALFRKFENFVVKVFRLNLTLGIAQVRSSRPLTDEESIRCAAKILAHSTYADTGVGDGFADIQQLEEIIKDYNPSKLYSESISQVVAKLRIYASELFARRV